MTPIQTTPDRTPDGWGRVADAYDADIAPTMTRYAQEALDATELQPGEAVLDVAAGSGAVALEAARRGAHVVAVDFAPEMVERLLRRAAEADLHVEAHVMDGQALELPDGHFDAAYCNLGLMFFPSPDRGLAEMRRVLRTDGRAAVATWNVPERSELFQVMFGALHDAVPDLPPPAEPPAAFSLSDPDDLATRMKNAGFRDVEVRQVERLWVQESPEEMWASMIRSNPVMPGLLEKVGTENAERVKEAYVARVRPMMRDGQVQLKGEVHLAIGRV